MIIAVKTREFKRDLDYDWEDYFPSEKVLLGEAGKLHRALEGGDVDSRFVTLVRSPDSPSQILLGVSVSTSRNDAVGRPIRTMAFLRAEEPEEANLLAAFFAECLCKPDSETLYNSKSGVARAVESLYQTKKPNDFKRFCERLTSDTRSGSVTTGRWEIRRDDTAKRGELAQSLTATIEGGSPFLFALTDRLPTDVLGSLGTMFDKAVVRIFSEATPSPKPIPGPHAEGGPSPRALAAAIGGIVLVGVLLVAAGRSCRSGPGKGDDIPGTNKVTRAIDSGNAGTNAPPSGRNSETNGVPIREQGGDSAGETQRDDSTNGVPLSVTTQAQAMTNVEDRASSQVNMEASHEHP